MAEPAVLRSNGGTLLVDLLVRNEFLADGSERTCYAAADGALAPTLRVRPGDEVVIRFRNELAAVAAPSGSGTATPAPALPAPPVDPCRGGPIVPTSTNLHFHGLVLPASCHQDDVLKTVLQSGDPPFEYRLRIPSNEAPGLYWYHAHVHGLAMRQVGGGASGALIVEGIGRADRELADLPQRVLVIRDERLLHPVSAPLAARPRIPLDRDGDAVNTRTGGGAPARDLSINYVPVPYPDYPPARIGIGPNERQLWRVVNASSVTYLNMAVLFDRVPQALEVVAVDGVPLAWNRPGAPTAMTTDHLGLPPGARLEFVVRGPRPGVQALLVTRSVDTGPDGENDPNRTLAILDPSATLPPPAAAEGTAAAPDASPAAPLPWIGDVAPARVRRFYFSEVPSDPRDPAKGGDFYLTEVGARPRRFDPANGPDVVVHQGEVEDWIIENRSAELHAFHIHQLHFQVRDWFGMTVNEAALRDTINVPFYERRMLSYPSVRIRMDFRDPDSVGTFVYHCHLLDHEDAGMMGTIRVEAQSSALEAAGAKLATAWRHLLAGLGGAESRRTPRPTPMCRSRPAARLGSWSDRARASPADARTLAAEALFTVMPLGGSPP